MVNGSKSPFITGIGDISISSPIMKCKTQIVSHGFPCETLQHSLVSCISLKEERVHSDLNEESVDLKF